MNNVKVMHTAFRFFTDVRANVVAIAFLYTT